MSLGKIHQLIGRRWHRLETTAAGAIRRKETANRAGSATPIRRDDFARSFAAGTVLLRWRTATAWRCQNRVYQDGKRRKCNNDMAVTTHVTFIFRLSRGQARAKTRVSGRLTKKTRVGSLLPQAEIRARGVQE
jgi:hypothetical protein